MRELKVKPCPFCGSDDISFSAFSLSPDAYALCNQCNAGIEIQVAWDGMTEKEHDEECTLALQKAWNRRDIEQPQLDPDQQKYLKQLQYNHKRLGNTHDALFFALVDYEKRWNFNNENFAQVLQVFSRWAME